jgi:hypothetical protein
LISPILYRSMVLRTIRLDVDGSKLERSATSQVGVISTTSESRADHVGIPGSAVSAAPE